MRKRILAVIALLILMLLICACGSNEDIGAEEAVDNNKAESEVAQDDSSRLNDFYIELTDSGSYDSIKSIAKSHDLYVGHDEDSYGNEYFKIAPTREESEINDSSAMYSGNHYVWINCRYLDNPDEIGEIVYVDNIRLIKATQIPGLDIKLMDYNRLTPAEGDSAMLTVSSPEDVVNYQPKYEPPSSPLEELFPKLDYEMDDVGALANENGLFYHWDKYESFITYADDEISGNEISCILLPHRINNEYLTYRYYPAFVNGGWAVILVSKDQADKDTKYSEGEGYYCISDSTEPQEFDSAEEAIQFLKTQRKSY